MMPQTVPNRPTNGATEPIRRPCRCGGTTASSVKSCAFRPGAAPKVRYWDVPFSCSAVPAFADGVAETLADADNTARRCRRRRRRSCRSCRWRRGVDVDRAGHQARAGNAVARRRHRGRGRAVHAIARDVGLAVRRPGERHRAVGGSCAHARRGRGRHVGRRDRPGERIGGREGAVGDSDRDVEGPAAPMVPVMTPVAGAMVTPAGRPVAL